MTIEKVKKNLEAMNGIIWEQSKDWLWISGNTYEYKEELKQFGCRWSKKRKQWYWKPSLKDAPLGVVEFPPKSDYTITTKDGYMGAIAWDGSNSKKHLYGAELSKAIRADFKKCNIKGVTISSKTYSGGQSIIINITPTGNDFISYDDYYKSKMENIYFGRFGFWLRDPETHKDYQSEYLHLEPQEVQDRIYKAAVKEYYESFLQGSDLNKHIFDGTKNEEFYGKSYTDIFQPAFLEKLQLIKKIVDSYNYDDSNSMVDYFNRGFYESYYLKPLKTA